MKTAVMRIFQWGLIAFAVFAAVFLAGVFERYCNRIW